MKKTVLMGVSILAMTAAAPAFAENANRSANANDTQTRVEAGIENAGEAVRETYEDIRAYFTDDDDLNVVSNVSIPEKSTANAMIGTNVQNTQGETIGKIHDILIDRDGDAELVIIENGGILGIGSKLAAFDYDVIEGYTESEDVVVRLNEDAVESATSFEYERSAANRSGNEAITVMPEGLFSVSKIIGTNVVDAKGNRIAQVRDVAFDGDDADYLIVAFDTILGMGGQTAALDLDALDVTLKDRNSYSIRMNQQQTAQFEAFKNQARN